MLFNRTPCSKTGVHICAGPNHNPHKLTDININIKGLSKYRAAVTLRQQNLNILNGIQALSFGNLEQARGGLYKGRAAVGFNQWAGGVRDAGARTKRARLIS